MDTFKKFLAEARRPDLKYDEKKVKGEIDKVTVVLEGSDSAVLTKLAKRYHALSKAVTKLEEKKKELNTKLSEDVEGFFNGAEDEVYTRMIETVAFTIQLSKQPKPVEKSEIDYENMVKALMELVSDDLKLKVEELIKAHTKTWTEKPRKPTLTVKPLEEGVVEVTKELLARAKEAAKGLLKELKLWGRSYSAKLKDLKRQAKKLGFSV